MTMKAFFYDLIDPLFYDEAEVLSLTEDTIICKPLTQSVDPTTLYQVVVTGQKERLLFDNVTITPMIHTIKCSIPLCYRISDIRSNKRVKVEVPALIHYDSSSTAKRVKTHDLSVDGLSILTDTPMTTAGTAYIKLLTDNVDIPYVRGVVAHQQPYKSLTLIGYKLYEASPQYTNYVQRLLS